MRILLVDSAKLKYAPYINFYADNIDKVNNEVHLIYWNRDLKPEDTSSFDGITLHEFRGYQEDDVPKHQKILSFIRFRQYVRRVVKQNKFDFVIVFSPAPILADILTFKFKERYIYDYRDSTYESFAPYKWLIGKVVRSSHTTFVSSDGFRRFLPSDAQTKIITSHNIQADSLNHRDDKIRYGKTSDKIRIAFWGLIREEETNLKMIDRFANDERFELHYYGREQDCALRLKEYAKEISVNNIYFHGEYKPEDRYVFVRNTEIIHNLYNTHNTMLAMSNKYYDSVIFRIPQICMKGSVMGDKVDVAKIGATGDPSDEKFADNIYSYYKGLNLQEFYKHCDDELDRLLEEYNRGVQIIKQCTSYVNG